MMSRRVMPLASACALATLVASAHALAQSPCDVSTVDEAEERAQAIFFGELEMYQEVSPDRWQASLKVEQVYKGPLKPGQSVQVLNGAEDDAVAFRVGRSYMVFAQRSGDKAPWTTGQCMMTQAGKKPPVAPGVESILPVAPGQGSATSRASRAGIVLVAEVTELGAPYAGGWHNALVEVKVKQVFKGKAAGKLTLRLDERSCQGAKRVIVREGDEDQEREAPVRKGSSYLFFLHSEDPHFAMMCHDNIAPLSQAQAAVEELKRTCVKGVCGSGAYDRAAALRAALRQRTLKLATASLLSCHKKHVEQGVISRVELDVALDDAGKIIVRNLRSEGSAESQRAYDDTSRCLIDAAQEDWELGPVQGDRVRMNMVLKLKEGKKGPTLEAASWSMTEDKPSR